MSVKKRTYDREYRRKYYEKLKADPVRYAAYKAKKAKYDKTYYDKHRDEIIERSSKWRAEHIDKLNEMRRAKRAAQREKYNSLPMAVCVVCGSEFSAYEYHPHGGRFRTKYCSETCRYEATKVRARHRYDTHKDEMKAQAIRWREENRERYLFLMSRRKKTEKYKAWAKAYRERKKKRDVVTP